jgi:hypothetical protein
MACSAKVLGDKYLPFRDDNYPQTLTAEVGGKYVFPVRGDAR